MCSPLLWCSGARNISSPDEENLPWTTGHSEASVFLCPPLLCVPLSLSLIASPCPSLSPSVPFGPCHPRSPIASHHIPAGITSLPSWFTDRSIRSGSLRHRHHRRPRYQTLPSTLSDSATPWRTKTLGPCQAPRPRLRARPRQAPPPQGQVASPPAHTKAHRQEWRTHQVLHASRKRLVSWASGPASPLPPSPAPTQPTVAQLCSARSLPTRPAAPARPAGPPGSPRPLVPRPWARRPSRASPEEYSSARRGRRPAQGGGQRPCSLRCRRIISSLSLAAP